jgi:hypothetical protein
MSKSENGGLTDKALTGRMTNVAESGDSTGNLHDGKSDVGVITVLPGKIKGIK